MIKLTDDLWQWIDENTKSSPDKLRLANHGNPDRLFAIDQIDARQRTAKKLNETLNACPRFIFDSTLAAQQSTSDLLAEFHASLIAPGSTLLDMTGGLGIDTIHFAKRAKSVTMIEINPERELCARHNFKVLGLTNVHSISGDSVEFLKQSSPNAFDYIFIDPARRGQEGQRLFALAHCNPDVTVLLDKMLSVAPTVIIKASPMLDIAHTLNELPHVKEIISLGTPTECKELLIICQGNYDASPGIKSVTLTEFKSIAYTVRTSTSADSHHYSAPQNGDILYDPYPSFAKIKMNVELPDGISKIAPNSNLYFAKELIPDFPGNPLKIIDIKPFNKKVIRELNKTFPEADISVRNFPISPKELQIRLKIKSGGKTRIFATTTASAEIILILCNSLQSS